MRDIDWKHITTALVLGAIFTAGGAFLDFQTIKAEIRTVKSDMDKQKQKMQATDSVVKFLAWAKCKEAIENKQADIIKKCDKYLTEGINAKNI